MLIRYSRTMDSSGYLFSQNSYFGQMLLLLIPSVRLAFLTGLECSPKIPQSKRRSIESPPFRLGSHSEVESPSGRYPPDLATRCC